MRALLEGGRGTSANEGVGARGQGTQGGQRAVHGTGDGAREDLGVGCTELGVGRPRLVEGVEPATLVLEPLGQVLRGETVPLVPLSAVLSGENAKESLVEDEAFVVVIRVGSVQYGLCVDRLKGELEVVIKPLGGILGNVNGVTLGYQNGTGQGDATASKDGNSWKISGTATGINMANPMQPVNKPFEIEVSCP